MLDRHLQAARKAIFVEAVLGPRAGVADAAPVLDRREPLLRADGGGVVEGVGKGPAALHEGGIRRVEGVQGDEDGAKGVGGDVLEQIEPVGEADGGDGLARGRGFGEVVPGRPGDGAMGHLLCCGVSQCGAGEISLTEMSE